MLPEAEVGDGYPMRPGGREAESEQTSEFVPPAAPTSRPRGRGTTPASSSVPLALLVFPGAVWGVPPGVQTQASHLG